MEITINTHVDDLPAVIRMLQAYCGPTPTSQTVEIAGVPADELYSGDALKAAIEPEEAEEPAPEPEEPEEPAPEQRSAAPIPSLFDSMPDAASRAMAAELAKGPSVTVSDVTVDAAGLPWDARIHSGAKSKLANGNWKLRRGVDPALVANVEAELRGAPKPAEVATDPSPAPVPPAPPVAPPTTAAAVAPPPPATAPATATPAPAAPSAPPTPPVPATPKPITNAAELVAAVMDKRFTTDQVNAACQAVGVENVASLLAKQDKLPAVLKELGV